MSQVFPLVRAGVLAPFLRWMRANAVPVAEHLRAADLPSTLADEPDRPVALASVLAFAHGLARRTSSDIGCRVVAETSLLELGSLGRLLLGARTPRESLARLTAVMNRHCTHELFTLLPAPGGALFREWITLGIDAEIRHIQHQYVAALVRALCAATGYPGEPFGRVELCPHPAEELAHLRGRLGPDLAPSRDRTLSIFIPAAVLDRPFPRGARDYEPLPADWAAIRGDGSYAGTARIVVEAMLDEGEPSVHRLAAASGASLRTLQRRLEEDGTSFSRLLDEARQTRALRDLADGSSPVCVIGAQLGYSSPPAFTRAVRRWAAVPPAALRAAPKPGRQ